MDGENSEISKNLNVFSPIEDKELLNNENRLEFLNKWLELSRKNMQEFAKNNEIKTVDNLEIEIDEILTLYQYFQTHLIFINNAILTSGLENFNLKESFTVHAIAHLSRFIQRINELIIISLSDFQSFTMGKSARKYVEDLSDKISGEINIINDTLLKFMTNWNKVKKKGPELCKTGDDLRESAFKISFFYVSLLSMQRKKQKPTKLKELLLEYELNQALSRLEMSEDFFNKKIWDKAVGDIRHVLEMTVTDIVRRTLGDQYWNQPYKDGIEILRQNGIICDEITVNHFKARDVGVYGVISLKGHHPDGTSDNNLANSELEANYFMSLAENIIVYLLSSFRESKFYKREKQE